MVRFSAKEVSVEIDAPEDIIALLQTCLEKLVSSGNNNSNEKRNSANAERCKRYRENKKHVEACHEHVTTMSNHVDDAQEEKEEEKGVFSPSSPSSLPSSPCTPINFPITPIIPTLPEKEEEREENILGAGGENEPPMEESKRGPLQSFGTFVRLSGKEYDALKRKFGTEKTMQMIRNMDSYIGEDPKRQRAYTSRNHYLTLLNWERRHAEEAKAKQPKQIPKEKTFRDIRIEMEHQEEDSVIDAFWRI